MNTIVTVVVDNIGDMGLAGEWGLCLLIEHEGKKILLDAGSSRLFLTNLKCLGFDVKDIDYGVLSHAHFDHGNGMPYFFKNNDKAKFFISDKAKECCYHRRKFFRVYIGLPRGVLKKFEDRIIKVHGDYQITDGVYLISHKTKGLDALGIREKMYTRNHLKWSPDDFSHEQSLVVDTKNGLVIFNSCSHGGVENIINEVQASFPDKNIYGYIGGLHLFNKTDEEVLRVAQVFKDKNIRLIRTGHCTKNHAYKILKEQLGDKIEQFKVGLTIEL